jgi:hypothetical protein
MTQRMPVPLVPGERGRAVLDAELPVLSREELDAILGLVGGAPDGGVQCPQVCPRCGCVRPGECCPAPSWARKVN